METSFESGGGLAYYGHGRRILLEINASPEQTGEIVVILLTSGMPKLRRTYGVDVEMLGDKAIISMNNDIG